VDKTLLTLEGLLRRVDPEFDYLDSAKPYVTRLISMRRDQRRVLRTVRKNAEDMYAFLGALPRQLQTSFRKFARGDVRIKVQHEELHSFIRDIDKSSNRIAFSVITAAIIVASSIIIHSGQGETIFGLPVFGLIGYVVAAFLGVWILIGIMRSGQL
jgi:ubiquinone biosynthesis protein